MNALRIVLVLVIGLLLPLRDVVAATMLCGVPASAGGQRLDTVYTSPADFGSPPCHGDASAADHAAATDEGGAPAGACPVCASGCHAAALALDAPRLPGALPRTAAAFPPLDVPEPAFEAGGPERPPRTP